MNNVLRAALAATALLVCPIVSGANLFREPLPVDVGFVPPSPLQVSLVTADFTGDGRPDLLNLQWAGTVPGEDLWDLVVVPADGTGPFAAPIRSRGARMHHLAAADVDGDGKQDLVGALPFQLLVFLGNGNGTFRAGSVLEDTTIDPQHLVIGDFTGDGKRDAAVITWGRFESSTLAVFPGDGSGSFGARLSTTVPPIGITELRAGDLNGDGADDIVTGGTANLVLLGGPSGLTWTDSIPGFAGPVAIGNLNDDDALDAAVFARNTLSLFAGNGNGGFTLLLEHTVPNALALAITDMTGDGRPEVLSLGPVVTILRARGAGVFDPPRFAHGVVTPGGVGSFVADDFDGDGKGDLVAHPVAATHASFLKGKGDGTLLPDRVWRTHPRVFADFPRPGVAADVTGDGRADVITTATEDGVHSLAVLRNDGTGELGKPILTPLPAANGNFTVGLLDAGSRPDVLMISGGSARVYFGNADGTFTAGPVTPLAGFDESLALADVTGDGQADLLTASTIYPGTDGGVFGAPRSAGISMRVTGDLNGDGVADAAGFEGSSHIQIGINDGTGNFAVTLLPRGEAQPKLIADFTGDGKADIFATTFSEAWVYPGRGDGTFDPPAVTLAVPMFPEVWKTADFDGDGNLDILAGTTLLLGHGDGRFHDMFRIGTGYADTGDFDGDGRPDIALFGAGVVRVMLNGLAPEPTAATATTVVSTESSTTYGAEVTFLSRTTGGITPVRGTVVLSAAGVPFALITADTFEPGNVGSVLAGVSRATPVGSYAVTATFTGNSRYQPSSGSVPLTVNRAPSELRIGAPFPVTYPGKVFFQVEPLRLQLPYLPGPVHQTPVVRSGDEELAVEWSTNGHGAISGLEAGTHPLTIELAGDDNYEPATATTTATVEKRGVMIEVTVTPEKPEAGPVTFDVVVDPLGTGTVNVLVDGNGAGEVTLNGGRAQFTTPLAAGTRLVTFEYSGDANHLAVTRTVPVAVHAPWGTPLVIETSFDGSAVFIRWTPVSGATSYRLFVRTVGSQPWAPIDLAVPWTSRQFASARTEMYAVAARNAAGTWTPMSAPKLFTAVLFTDDPVMARVTRIKGEHISQLRTAANAVRKFAGLTPFTFTLHPVVQAVHVAELRTAISEARSALGMPVTFTDPVLTARTSVIRAVHIQELRNAVR